MSDEKSRGGFLRGWFKTLLGATLGLMSGVVGVYATAIVDRVAKPTKPLANFTVGNEGLKVQCQNQAVGESGWWDFGDGTMLVPFDPAQPSVSHDYSKPGHYDVKLVVRNFLQEEHDRAVSVDLTAAAPAALPPSIVDLKVEPIGNRSVAPATFRVRGEVKNADKVLLDLGDKVEGVAESGPIDRYVVFEKAGQYPIQLIGSSGKTAVKQGSVVVVSAPVVNTISAIVRVSDSGTRTERMESSPVVPLMPVKGAKTVERVLAVKPGCKLVSATVDKFNAKTLANLKAEVAADGKSVKLTGNWIASTTDAKGTDGNVQLKITEEKSLPVKLNEETISGTFAGNDGVRLLMPPQPRGLTAISRKMKLEIRQAGQEGTSTPIVVEPEMKLPWTKTITGPGFKLVFSAETEGDALRLRMTQSN